MTHVPAALLAGAVLVVATAQAEEAQPLPTMQVTATREPEPVDQVPASVTVITGESLRARGANDLRTALSLVAGVEGTPGGDGGPAGAVPSLWGLREADAYLLVVDNVPWGGAFNPATPSLNLNGVERIEILRGAAPVMYGATSFVGVIHVMHYAAGQMPATVSASGGSYGSAGAGVTLGGPSRGAYQQSLVADAEKRGSSEDRTLFSRYHALYRGAATLGSVNMHVDGDVSVLPQRPDGNLLLRDGGTLHTEFGPDTNFNPDGAKLDQNRYQLALGLDGKAPMGEWGATLAVTRTLDGIFRGFLRGNSITVNPPDAGVGDGLQADGYAQTRGVTDVYFDAHAVTQPARDLRVTYGVDHLYGHGRERATNFGYCIDASGQEYSCAGAHGDDELVASSDDRNLSGLYTQLDWDVGETLDVLAGLRLNRTQETAEGEALDVAGGGAGNFSGSDSASHTRLTGVVGASWRAWASGHDLLTLYADYRNTFKPLAIDFGPEAEVSVLQPETAQSYELGAKTQLLGGRLDIDTSVFQMDFSNGLTFVDDGSGTNTFVRANGGETRFLGFEIESRYEIVPHTQLAAHYANHDARFRKFTRDNGANADDNRVEMSPYQTAGIGLLYAPPTGFNAALIDDFIGRRKLNKSNSVDAGGYSTIDASLGWRCERVAIVLNGYNLSNQRVPVAESELQETVTVTGTAGYYRLPARAVMLSVSVPF